MEESLDFESCLIRLLHGKVVTGCNLSYVSLREIDLSHADLRGVNLRKGAVEGGDFPFEVPLEFLPRADNAALADGIHVGSKLGGGAGRSPPRRGGKGMALCSGVERAVCVLFTVL